MSKQNTSPDQSARKPDEEKVEKEGKEPGRDESQDLKARDSTSINAKSEEPIDPEMPDLPPA